MKIIEFNEEENSKNLNRILLGHLAERTHLKTRNESSISLAAFEEDNYIGGITAQKVFETCFVDLLAVEKKYQELGVGRKLILELENEVKDSGEYINVTNIYNVEEGEIIIAYDNKLKEKKYSEMEKNKEMSMEYIRSKANEVIPQHEITSEEDLMNF